MRARQRPGVFASINYSTGKPKEWYRLDEASPGKADGRIFRAGQKVVIDPSISGGDRLIGAVKEITSSQMVTIKVGRKHFACRGKHLTVHHGA